MQISLKDKTALVCGSTSGIGKAIAIQLAECGASVILFARDEKKLKETIQSLNASGNHKYIAADFSDNSSVKKSLQNISKEKIDIIVNNTGGPPAADALSSSPEDFTRAFNSHLINNQIIVSSFIEGMKERKFGRIINIISTSVKQPIKGLGVSNTIRGAVASWAKTISIELAPYGITVNNILPGATATGRLTSLIKNKSEKSGKSESDLEIEMQTEIPAGRFAQPEEPAYLAAFLSSDFASYINGVSIAVDGGRTGCL